MGLDPRKVENIIKNPSELLNGLEVLRDDYKEFQATSIPDNPGFWWKLVHLDPSLYRGAVLGVASICAGFGLVISDKLVAAIAAFVIALVTVVQAVWTRKAVTPNAKVVVFKPNPVDQPTVVAPGEAVSTNMPAVIQAANQNATTGQQVVNLPILPEAGK